MKKQKQNRLAGKKHSDLSDRKQLKPTCDDLLPLNIEFRPALHSSPPWSTRVIRQTTLPLKFASISRFFFFFERSTLYPFIITITIIVVRALLAKKRILGVRVAKKRKHFNKIPLLAVGLGRKDTADIYFSSSNIHVVGGVQSKNGQLLR